MKSLYLVNMKEEHFGGLFKATYERLKRHTDEQHIVNINYYDSLLIAKVKQIIFRHQPLKQAKNNYQYKELTIHNLNINRDIIYYINKLLKREQKNLDAMFNFFLKKNTQDLTKIDLIHAHWGYPNGYLAYQLGEKYQIPYFITFHGSDVNNIQPQQQKYLLEAMEKASQCFFVSQQLLDNAKKMGYSGVNATINYNGVDTNEFKISGKLPQDKKVVGYIGALEKVKGADLLSELFAAIKKKNPTVSFVIIGEGTLKESVQAEALTNDLDVHFVGQIPFEEIPNYLQTIDVLVMPSRNEGLGMIILEAHAMGIPVVAAKVGGIPEAIGHEEDLIDFDEQLVDQMAQRTVTLLTKQNDQRIDYRQRVVDQFSWEQSVNQEKLFYRSQLVDEEEGRKK